jgi:glutamate synthase domain-containing protein 1
MCGIVAYLDRTGDRAAPVGRVVLAMLEALGCRGPDSTGVALYADRPPDVLVLRIKLGEGPGAEARAEPVAARVAAHGRVRRQAVQGEYLRLEADGVVDPRALERAVEAVAPDVELVSLGTRLEIVKQVGSPANLEKTFGVSGQIGTHGIGHTRLSTESRVDLSHSQPFWAHGRLDLAIVHNGHITNYHKLRRRHEQRGVRFYTGNDSEVIGVYLADRLARGLPLREALEASIRDLDGSFSYLAATAAEVGFAKDPFGLKPLVVAETEGFVAIATEEIAIRRAFPGVAVSAVEPPPRTARAWAVPAPVAAWRAA